MPIERRFPRENANDPNLPPIEEVLNQRQRGFSRDDIISNLSRDNYSQGQINDAMTQAEIKNNIAGRYPYTESANLKQLENSAPSPSSSQPPPRQDFEPSTQPEEEFNYSPEGYSQPMMPATQPSFQEEHVEELVESVVNEKWEDFTGKIGDIGVWKETTKNDIESIKQEILRVEQRFENLQKSVLGKVTDYSKGIQDIGADIKALEQVLQKILGPLTTNVRELSKIAEKVKAKKSSGKKKK